MSETPNRTRPVLNRVIFALLTLVLGGLAGAFVWVFFFLLNHGINLFWHVLPEHIGAWWWPLAVCLVGGVAIGLFERRFGAYPEDLNKVMAQVKETGRYEYKHIGASAGGALLPLLFGGSVGPEAGLTGVIAGLCTWVGDRLKFLGKEFRELSQAGTAAVLSAVFNAPLFGLAAPLLGSCDEVKAERRAEGLHHAALFAPRVARRPFLPDHLRGHLLGLWVCAAHGCRSGVLPVHLQRGAHGRHHASACHDGVAAVPAVPGARVRGDARRCVHWRGAHFAGAFAREAREEGQR